MFLISLQKHFIEFKNMYTFPEKISLLKLRQIEKEELDNKYIGKIILGIAFDE